MHLVINGNYYGQYMQEKDVDRVFHAFENYLKDNIGKQVKIPKLRDNDFVNEYAEVTADSDGYTVTVQAVKNIDKMQEYLYSEESLYDEVKNHMLDALNAIGKELPHEDQNIYIVQDELVVGKTEDLESANNFIYHYLDKNSKNQQAEYFKNFFCLSKKEINKDNCGYTKVLYFERSDGKFSSFSLIYPLEAYQKHIELAQNEKSIFVSKNYETERLVLGQIEEGQIKNIDDVPIAVIEENAMQKSGKDDWKLFNDVNEAYHRWQNKSQLRLDLMEKRINVNESNRKIRNTVRHTCLRPNNEKWILEQYQKENPTAERLKNLSGMSVQDYDRYAVRCLIEREENLDLAQAYLKSNELKTLIERAINQTDSEEKTLYAEVQKKEKEYQAIAPEFSIRILAQKELEGTKER